MAINKQGRNRKPPTIPQLLELLSRLEEAHIHYDLFHSRSDAIMIRIAVPGERWEIEFLADGHIDVERFRSDGEIHNEDMIDELFSLYSDIETPSTASTHDSA